MKTNYFKLLKSSLMVLFLCLGLSSWGQTTVTSNFGATSGDIDGNISFTTQQNDSQNAPAWTSNQLRLYYHSGGNGGSVTLHPAEGIIITDVSLTTASTSYTPTVKYNIDGGGDQTAALSGTTYTISGIEASDNLRIRNANTTNTQLRLTGITVTYITATSCEASNIAFTNTTVNKDLLDPSFTQTATSLNATTAITYESSDEAVATVNAATGEVSLVGVGTATITATQEAGEHSGVDYCAGTAIYELTVITTEPLLTVSTNSVSFTGFAGGAAATEDITVEGLNLTGDIALALSGDTNFSINPTSLSSTGGAVTITYTPSATPATHSATLTVSNGSLSEVITLSGETNEMPAIGCFEENFDDITTGNSTSSSGSSSAWTGNSAFPTVSTAYQAGGAVRLGSSSNMGSITSTPLTDFQGQNVTVNFASKAWGTASTSILVSFGTQSQVVNLPAVADWTDGLSDYEISFENIEANAMLKFESNSTSERRFFIDNIAVCLDVPSTDPALSVSESEITDLNYGENNGPSAPQSFILSGENLDGSEVTVSVTAPFEVSTSETTGFADTITLAAYDGTSSTIWVRLATGQVVGDYNGTVAISGGDAATINITVSGSVLAVPVVTDAFFEGTVGVAFNEQIQATENPTLYTITINSLLAGLSLDSETGIISGTPTEAGVVELLVTATNAAGTSAVGGIVIEIAKGTQTLDGFADLTKYDTDAPFDLPETTQAGLAVSYASSNTAVATVDANTVTIVGLGTTTITATQAGDANWNELEQTITLTVIEEPEAPWEDFETGTKGSYTGGFVSSTAGEWYMDDALLGTAANDRKNGNQSVRLRNGYIETNFDITNGVGTVSVLHAKYGSDSNTSWQLYASTDGGATWTAYGDVINTTSTTLTEANFTLNLSGNVRLRISKDDTQRINLDDIYITNYSSSTAVTWTGTEWINGVPSITEDVVIEGVLFVGTDVTSFEAKSLTLASTGALLIESGNSITVAGAIDNQATAEDFVIEAGGNLIQNDDVENTGAITVKVEAQTEYFGFNMFSSPVAGQSFIDFSDNNGNEVFEYGYTDDETGDWEEAAGSSFVAGHGYLFAAPYEGFPQNTLTTFYGEFTGVPNNGDVTVSANNEFVSLGNPYPSAIDADELLSANANVGALYFWTNANLYDYDFDNPEDAQGWGVANNYVVYNATGQTNTSGNGGDFDASNVIMTGQGFIAATTTNETVSFDNDMRFSDSGTFYKVMEEDKHRLWLNLEDQNNFKNQILIGYMEGASHGVDARFDAKMFGYDGSALYSLIDNSEANYAIQGRYPFINTDVVPLGFRAVEGGTYTISLANFDGLFAEGQDIFLKDNLTESLIDLKEEDYTFVSGQGVFDARFEVVYNATMSVNNPTLDNNWVVYKQNGSFQILSQGFDMSQVTVFDMLGRTIYQSEVEGASHQLPEMNANGVLIIRVNSVDNGVSTKKVIN